MRARVLVAAALATLGALAFATGRAAASTTVHCADNASDQATLQSAIDAGGTVTVYGTCLGTYTVTLNDVTVQAGAAGATIDGGGSANAVISVSRPFTGGSHTLTLDGMTITGGDGGGIVLGCGFCAEGNVLNLNDSSVTGNSDGPNGSGGGIDAVESATVNVSDSTISNNSSGFGGGIAIQDFSSLDMSNSIVTANTAAGRGGGLWLGTQASDSISGSQITQNSSGGPGGGVLAIDGSPSFAGTKVSWNRSVTFGGGIASECADLTLTGSTVDHNRAGSDGGGISNGTPSDSHQTCGSDGTVEVDQSTVSANVAARNGGGVANFGDCGTTTLSTNGSAFGGNLATSGRGGAVYNTNAGCGDSSAVVSLSHTTVGRLPNTVNPDRAEYGAGIFNAPGNGSSEVDLEASTAVSGNQASVHGGGVFDCPGAVLSLTSGAAVSQNIPDNIVNGSTCP